MGVSTGLKTRPYYPNPKPDKRWKSDAYRKMVSMERCLWCGAAAPNEPHHISWAGDRGWSQKVHDYLTCPACQRCHNAMHQMVGPWFRSITRKIGREEIKGEMVHLMWRWIMIQDPTIILVLSELEKVKSLDDMIEDMGEWMRGNCV